MNGLLRDPDRGAARCEALLQATEAIVWTTSPEGHPVEDQPSWQAYTGQCREDYDGLGWLNAIHADDRPRIVSSWEAARASQTMYQASARLWHAPSQVFRQVAIRAAPVRGAQGELVEWMGSITDIHERALSVAELHRLNQTLSQQLEAQSAEMRRLFDLSLDILLCVGADGRLLTVSPSFEQVTGVPAAQALGMHYADFVVPEEVRTVAEEIAAVLGGRHAVDFETRLRHVDGSTRAVSWRAVGLPGEGRVYAVGRDITQLQQAYQRTIRAERLEAVGRLTGGIAHDFNNILAAMMGYLEVGARTTTDEKMRRLFIAAIQAGQRGAKLVGQLLSFARKQELSLRPCDLNELVKGLQPMIEQVTRSRHTLDLSLAQGLPQVIADPTQVEMVLLNLAINARDAMPDGGRISIQTWQHEVTEPASRIDDLPLGRYGCVTVADTGQGMDEQTLARCFEPFFTTKPTGHGTGLGLAQALGVVQYCGGAMRVDSKPGAGTRIDVLLPARLESSDPSDPPPPPTLDRPSVLVVDDDPLVLGATAALLDALGCDVASAKDGEAAVALLIGGRPVELLLTTFELPGMSGADLLRAAQQLRPKVMGILMTGDAEPERIQSVLPGVTVVTKPLQPDRLAALLAERVSEHRRATGELDKD